MSGPPYPPPPLPGSNAIGQFIIGTSPIGTISPFDFWRTVISQYANSPRLTEILDDFSQCIDQTANLEDFFDKIMNVDTAEGYGLDVWGRIVGVSRILHLATESPFWGFQEAGDAQPFNQAPFYSGSSLTNNFTLSDEAFRTLIFLKALSNISDGSVAAINQLLMRLFPNQGNCYATDGGDMTMTYRFTFFLTPVQLAILANSGVPPKPVGVSLSIVQGAPS